MPIDRVLAIVGIIIGLPGVLILFVTANETLAVFAGILAALLLGAAFYIRYIFNAPPYTFREVNATLEFPSDEQMAVLRKAYKIRPNYAQLHQIELKNIAADGRISNFLWNDKPIPSHAITTRMGQFVVRIDLPFNPGRWRTFEGKFSYEIRNSFNENPEWMEYTVDFPTKIATLTILFPKTKPCLSTEAHKKRGAGSIPIQMPTRYQDGMKLELTLKRPSYGGTYYIYWHW